MTDLTRLIEMRTLRDSREIRPVLFDLGELDQRKRFEDLLSKDSSITVVDELLGQLLELVKISEPGVEYSSEMWQQKALDHIGETPIEYYGTWVYYPWLSKAVHLLPKDEFVQVRTNRNMYKITLEERDLLSTKTIGVVGLSVGHSIVLTLAQERLATEFRIADFDEIELSNLNRIRTSTKNLGISKTAVVAREIAEIDPFIQVKIWDDGLTENNLNAFFFDGGNLDLIFDECDSLDVKVLIRETARKEGIPVVMDTSDRGMIDIERFDIERDRPIFHGLAGGLDYEVLKGLQTSEEKVPYVLPIVGVDTMSKRMKASMMEIGESISTWPQLASAVNYGGGISADIARRILLGQIHESGRYFFDPADLLIPENKKEANQPWKENPFEPISQSFIDETIRQLQPDEGGEDVPLSTLEEMLEAAILAPSGGNMQPWYWYYDNARLYLFLDAHQSYSMLDFEHRGSYLALGAALENLRLAAVKLGYNATFDQFPLTDNKQLAARVRFNLTSASISMPESELVEAIGKRQTNRNLRERQTFATETLSELLQCGSDTPLTVNIITDFEKIQSVGKLMSDGERVRLMHEWSHNDFLNEIRWTEAENLATKNGVDIETVELTPSDIAGIKIVSDWDSVRELRDINEQRGGKLKDLALKTFDSTSALLLISAENASARDYLEVGRVAERLWLKGTAMEIAMQPVGAPLFLAYRGIAEPGTYSTHQLNVMMKLVSQVPQVFNVTGHKPLFLLRLHKAEFAKMALRKPLSQVFAYAGEEWTPQNEKIDLSEEVGNTYKPD